MAEIKPELMGNEELFGMFDLLARNRGLLAHSYLHLEAKIEEPLADLDKAIVACTKVIVTRMTAELQKTNMLHAVKP